MKPGRKPRKEAVVKTTVYFLESDLKILNSKNRIKALALAREISANAVHDVAAKKSAEYAAYDKLLNELVQDLKIIS